MPGIEIAIAFAIILARRLRALGYTGQHQLEYKP